MKHTKLMAVVTLLTLAAGVASAQSSSTPSLGDAARAASKNKADASPATRHYDNDNLPTNDALSVVGPEPVAATSAQSKDAASVKDKDNDKDKNNDKKPADPTVAAAERQKSADEMKKKLAEQQQKIDALNHEISLDQREDRLRAAAFYSDAGTQLRNSAEWQKEQTQSKNDADAKQKALDAAKQQYDEMQEQARKAGIKQKDPDASSDRDQNKDKQ
jgi:hypothetical protein